MRCFRLVHNERGATLVLVVLALVVLLGMAALSIDVGQLYTAKQRAQNVCDAGALNGAQYLTGASDCTAANGKPATAAQNCATGNNAQIQHWKVSALGSESPGVTVDFPTSVTDVTGTTTTVPAGSAIRVRGNVKVNFAFAGALSSSLTNYLVPASATAVLDVAQSIKGSLTVPFAVSDKTIFGDGTPLHPPAALDPNAPAMTLKSGSWQGSFIGPGNFGLVDLGSDLRSELSGDAPPLTVTTDGTMTLGTVTGNKVGQVKQGLAARLAKEHTYPDGEAGWQAWLAAKDPVTGMYPFTWRLVLVPVILDPQHANGSSTVTVVGMAGFYIDSASNGTDVTGHFIQGIRLGQDIKWVFPAGTTTSDTLQLIKAIRLLS